MSAGLWVLQREVAPGTAQQMSQGTQLLLVSAVKVPLALLMSFCRRDKGMLNAKGNALRGWKALIVRR